MRCRISYVAIRRGAEPDAAELDSSKRPVDLSVGNMIRSLVEYMLSLL